MGYSAIFTPPSLSSREASRRRSLALPQRIGFGPLVNPPMGLAADIAARPHVAPDAVNAGR